VNRLSLSSYNSADLSPLCSDVWGPCAGRSGHYCDHCSNSSGRLVLRRSGLVSIRFTRRSSSSPRRDDLTNYWAHGPFVRSLILLVDTGDIRPPQAPSHVCLHCSTWDKIWVKPCQTVLVWVQTFEGCALGSLAPFCYLDLKDLAPAT
jgi:hypothetical protein